MEGGGHNDIEVKWRDELFEQLSAFLLFLNDQ